MSALIITLSIFFWLAGAHFTARQYAINELEKTAKHHASLTYSYKPGDPLIDDSDRSMAWGEAWSICLFGWPIVLLAYGFRRVVNIKPLVPPTEQARLERAELEQLRSAVREHKIKGGELL